MRHSFDIDDVLDRVARGNRDAFLEIVRTYNLPLRSFLASQVHHLEDIDDLAQETFLTAFRKLTTFRRDDDFGAWLRGIARNKLHCYFRSSTRRAKRLAQFQEEATRLIEVELDQVSTDDAEVIEVLLHCVAQLPEKLRQVVRAGLAGDKPLALAAQFGTTVGAIYNLHYRANRLLRDCVEKELS